MPATQQEDNTQHDLSPGERALQDQRSAATGKSSTSPEDLANLEAAGGLPSIADKDRNTAANSLGDKEAAAEGGAGGIGDAANAARNAASFAYNPEGAAANFVRNRFRNFFWGGKKAKRRTLLGGATGVGIIVLGIFFIATLPNELVALSTDLQSHLFAGVEADISAESDRLVSDYMRDRMEKSLGLQCKKLRTCIQDAKKNYSNCKQDDDICRLFSKWDDSDLAGQFEGKGYSFQKDDNGRWNIYSDELPGGKLDIHDAIGDKNTNLFDFANEKVPGFGDTLRDTKETLVVARGSYLHNIFTRLFPWTRFYGDKAGTSSDPDPTKEDQTTKENAFNEVDTGEAVASDAQVLADSEKCLADNCDPTKRNPPTGDAASDINPVQQSDFETSTTADEEATAAALDKTSLKDLYKKYTDLKAKGADALADALADAIGKVTGSDVTKEASKAVINNLSDKVSGPIAVVQISAQILNFAHTVGTTLVALNFTVHYYPYIARAVEIHSEADKEKSGCTNVNPGQPCPNDLTMIGSFASALHANGSTATGGCYANYVINSNSDQQSAAQVHSCLTSRHMALNDYSNPVTQISSFVNSIPFFGVLLNFVNILNGIIGAILFIPNLLIQAIIHATGLDAIIGKVVSALIFWIAEHALPVGGIMNPGGADVGDTVAIGTHLMGWTAGRSLGGKRVTPTQAGMIMNTQLNAEQKTFQNQPLYARMFSKDTPYSFASQLAVKIPTNVSTLAQTSFADLLQNPLGKLFGSFATVLHPGNVFAAATPANSPDGLWENLIPLDDPVFKTDSETYQNQNDCVAQSKQDYPNWNKHAVLDKGTGQIYYTQTNGCLLQQRTMEAMGTINGYSD
jgi:hypothetical protein